MQKVAQCKCRHLRAALAEVGVDHFTVGGDTSLPIGCEISPEKMVKLLDEHFQMLNDIPLKILSRQQLTEEEKSVERLTSLRVFASATSVDEGLPRLKKWLDAQVPLEPGDESQG